jgi:hypothetical protein
VKLPNAHRSQVDRSKITHYLLNAAHPDNGGKAAFFERMGFAAKNWSQFARALRQVGSSGVVTNQIKTPFGAKYIVDGQLTGIDGSLVWVRTIWLIEAQSAIPRLISAYPHQREV